MAGALKREEPKVSEDIVLIRAMRDSNLPKFVYQDLPLFKAIIYDLFPGIFIPEVNNQELVSQVMIESEKQKLIANEGFIEKNQ